MKGFGDLYKDKKKKNKPPTATIINQAIQFHLQGNIKEATKLYQQLISQECNDHRVFSNYGAILQGLGKLKDAELSYRKAIQLNPNYANAYSNLGNVLKNLGKFEDAELSYRKAIQLNPDYVDAHYNLGIILTDIGKLKDAELSYRKVIQLNPHLIKAYYLLSRIKFSDKDKMWQDQVFCEDILINKSKTDKVDIYFTRANILHKERNYKESSKYLNLANKLKLEIKPSKPNNFIDKFKALLIESDKQEIPKKEDENYYASIFIVGMPRSGSTLVESILSMRNDVYDLGESNLLDESFMEYINSRQDMNLAEVYRKKVNNKTKLKIITNKDLYNFQYAGIIANQIPNTKIIHCFRNPLDNILSIYRAHFTNGNEYSSSLVDCARIYIEQVELMNKYKKKFKTIIYELNYDSLVTNPNQEIKSLISWLNWEWDDKYLSPHLNMRSVSTASNVQVRSPINSKSIGGWKNYKEMLQPVIDIFTKVDSCRDLIL